MLKRCRLSGTALTLGGMAGGVAFVAAVPGLAPGAFMRQGEGLPVLSRRPVPHKSPQRKLGDCDVAHQLDKNQALRGGSAG